MVMNKTFDIPLKKTQQTASSLGEIVFTEAQRKIVKKACGVPYARWKPRKTGLEGRMPFLIGWAAQGGTTTCCPCGCSAGCGLVLRDLEAPKGVARFTLVSEPERVRQRAPGRRKILKVVKRLALRKARSVPLFDARRNPLPRIEERDFRDRR